LKSAKSIPIIVSAGFRLVSPIGGSPVFLLLTREYARQQRKLRAGRVVINSFILLIVSFVVRTRILWFFGISLAEALFMQRKRWRQSRTCAPACIIEIECMRTAILPH